MGRTRAVKLVVAFSTTTAALKMEAVCGPENGRLIPTPKEISAGCGLAWCADPDKERELSELMEQNQISFEAKQIIELYV